MNRGFEIIEHTWRTYVSLHGYSVIDLSESFLHLYG